MTQIWFEHPAIWAIPYLGWGFVFLVVVSISTKIVLRWQRRHMRLRTDEAGVPPVVIPVRTGPSWLSDIEGLECCVGFIILAIVAPILAAFGIFLPLTLPQTIEDLIGMTFVIFIGALFWGGGIIGIGISIDDFRKRKRQLEEALETPH
ncbi:MAG: hypothetical protein ACFE89_02610 [Candidatus Hodarchaeota archaeon]